MIPSESRRRFLSIPVMLLITGCLNNQRGGELSAETVDQAPGNVTPEPYPQEDLQDSYITEAVTKAISADGAVRVEVPGEDFKAMREIYDQLPHEGSGAWVTYEETVVKIMIVKYE